MYSVAGIVCICGGILFIIIGILSYNSDKKKMIDPDFIKTIGYVVDYKIQSDNEGYETKTIIVEYEVGNSKYRITDKLSSTPPKPIGSPIDVYYKYSYPVEAILGNQSYSKFCFIFSSIFLIVGIILIIIQ